MPPGEPVVAKAPPKKEVPMSPQEVKLTPGLLPVLKEEGSKIRLKEDAPFMLHREEKLEPTIEAKTFKSDIEFAPPKPALKPITARIEMGDTGENKPQVVHYSEMRTSLLPAEPRQAGISPNILGGDKSATPDMAAKEPTGWRGAAPVAESVPPPRQAPTPPQISAPPRSTTLKQDVRSRGNVVDLR